METQFLVAVQENTCPTLHICACIAPFPIYRPALSGYDINLTFFIEILIKGKYSQALLEAHVKGHYSFWLHVQGR